MCISAIDRKRSVGQNQICAKTPMKIYMEITPCNFSCAIEVTDGSYQALRLILGAQMLLEDEMFLEHYYSSHMCLPIFRT
jgi:hypothetical protein